MYYIWRLKVSMYIQIHMHTHVHTFVILSLSHVRLFATPWTVAHQAPLSLGFPREAYWSGLPFFLLQGVLLTQGSNLQLLHCQAGSLLPSHQGSPCIHKCGLINKCLAFRKHSRSGSDFL